MPLGLSHGDQHSEPWSTREVCWELVDAFIYCHSIDSLPSWYSMATVNQPMLGGSSSQLLLNLDALREKRKNELGTRCDMMCIHIYNNNIYIYNNNNIITIYIYTYLFTVYLYPCRYGPTRAEPITRVFQSRRGTTSVRHETGRDPPSASDPHQWSCPGNATASQGTHWNIWKLGDGF